MHLIPAKEKRPARLGGPFLFCVGHKYSYNSAFLAAIRRWVQDGFKFC